MRLFWRIKGDAVFETFGGVWLVAGPVYPDDDDMTLCCDDIVYEPYGTEFLDVCGGADDLDYVVGLYHYMARLGIPDLNSSWFCACRVESALMTEDTRARALAMPEFADVSGAILASPSYESRESLADRLRDVLRPRGGR